jgi:hypothetical protein
MRTPLLLSAILLGLAVTSRADVIVVDASGADPVLQSVIDLAQDGDILLVKPGDADHFSTVTLAGKGLTIVADGGPVTVGRLIVSGCTVTSPPQFGGGWGFSPPGMAGALVIDSASVVMLRSRRTGGRGNIESPSCTIAGYVPPSPGGDGLQAIDSTVVVHASDLTGGPGGPGVPTGGCPAGGGIGEAGGSGLRASGSAVHVAGSLLVGAGMSTLSNGSLEPGSGLTVDDVGSSVTLRETLVVAGEGPPTVPDVVAPDGTITEYPAPARSLRVSTPVREHGPGTLTINGEVGDLTALFTAFTGGSLPVPGKQGVFSLGVPFFGPFLLGVNPSGDWEIPFQAGGLTPPTLSGQTFLLQLVVQDGGQVLFEGNTTFVLVDVSIQ